MNKKYLLIFFFFMCLIVNLLTNTILSDNEDLELLHQFTNEESKIWDISLINNDEKSKVSSIIKKYDNLSVIKKDLYIGAYCGSAIYFKNYLHSIPLIEGEFFYDSDFQDNLNTIVIGKNLENYIKYKDDEKYVDVNGTSYKVKGIMGYKNKNSLLDNTFYVNLNYYLNQNQRNPVNSLIITNKSNKNQSNLIEEIKKISEISYSGKYNNENEDVKNNTIFKIYFIFILSMIIDLSILNIIYLNKRKEEVGIRKLYGASNENIVMIFLKDYILIGLQGSILAFISNVIIIKLHICEEIFNNKIYLSSFFITLILTFVLEILFSYINVYKCNKEPICNLIKEE